MKCPPSALMDEDPDVLSTLASFIEWSDKERERAIKEANNKRR